MAKDYNKKIKQPIWLLRMHQKIRTNAYLSFGDFDRDVRLLFNNCVRYNVDNNAIKQVNGSLIRIYCT